MLIPKRDTVIRIHDYLIARLGGESGILKPESRLDNAMDRPKMRIYGHEPYKDTISKSAVLAHGLISLHPFVDGNKRTAVQVLKLTMLANGIDITYPPYIVKYSVQAALDTEHPSYADEEEFINLIMPLCSHSTYGRFLRRLRYRIIPAVPFRGYTFLARRFPNSRLISRRFERILLDWFAAGDRKILETSIREFYDLSKKGYPREVQAPKITDDDMEEIPTNVAQLTDFDNPQTPPNPPST